MKKTQGIVLSGITAALYFVLCVLLSGLSYGPVQFRVAEALTILPFFNPVFIPGIFIGAFLAALTGGLGAVDIIFGSFFSLAAAYLTWKVPSKYKWLAPLPPVLINAFGVSAYIAPMFNTPYWLSVAYVFAGEFVCCYLLGLPLLYAISKNAKQLKFPVADKD